MTNPAGPERDESDLAAARNGFSARAERMLIGIEDALVRTDLRAVDQGLSALGLAAQSLGYGALAYAARTGRGILGMAPGLDMVALRQALDLTTAVGGASMEALAYSDLRFRPLSALAIDQEQYWTAIDMHIQLQSSERPPH